MTHNAEIEEKQNQQGRNLGLIHSHKPVGDTQRKPYANKHKRGKNSCAKPCLHEGLPIGLSKNPFNKQRQDKQNNTNQDW